MVKILIHLQISKNKKYNTEKYNLIIRLVLFIPSSPLLHSTVYRLGAYSFAMLRFTRFICRSAPILLPNNNNRQKCVIIQIK